MKYFLDTEFIEGSQKTFFGKTKPTIDLISIGIVCENGQTYYAISKDFNLKHVWNNKDTWVKDNVLKSIYRDCFSGDARNTFEFSYNTMKYILRNYGKSNKEIAKEIKQFVGTTEKPEFYGYFCDYDWVVFCWLFGKMLDLPKGFPMYCKDLKQILDEKQAQIKDISSKHFLNPDWLQNIKNHPDYPKQENEHNALDDAKWNLKLFNFLKLCEK